MLISDGKKRFSPLLSIKNHQMLRNNSSIPSFSCWDFLLLKALHTCKLLEAPECQRNHATEAEVLYMVPSFISLIGYALPIPVTQTGDFAEGSDRVRVTRFVPALSGQTSSKRRPDCKASPKLIKAIYKKTANMGLHISRKKVLLSTF